jgi:hypothetical protein
MEALLGNRGAIHGPTWSRSCSTSERGGRTRVLGPVGSGWSALSTVATPVDPGSVSARVAPRVPTQEATLEPTRDTPRTDLAELLARWVSEGLIAPEQASAILAHELAHEGAAASAPLRAPATEAPPALEPLGARPVPEAAKAPRPRRIPVVAEALGYLGGILGTVGIVLLVARYWPDMATGGRLALSGGGALALLGAGALVHEESDPALARLRGFLWLASSAASALFGGVLMADAIDVERDATIALGCSAAVALQTGELWWRRDRPLQQLPFLASLVVFMGALVAELADGWPSGIMVWLVGVAYVGLGLQRQTRLALLTLGTGAVALVAGAGIVASDWESYGLPFAVASAIGLLAVALVPGPARTRGDQLVTGIIGGIMLVQTVPGTLVHFAREGGVATGITTWVVGGALVVIGMRRLVRLPIVVEMAGGAAIIGGAAITGAQSVAFATIFGLVTAVALIALGMLPGRVLLSVFGSIGLLVNVPWAIDRFFPGEGRAPLLVAVSGALILAVAVALTRMRDRFRSELGGPE